VIGRALFGVRTGLVAAAIVAVFPNLVFYTATLQLETAFTALALAAVAVAVTHDWSTGPPSRTRLLVFGTVLACSTYVRPFSLPFVAGIAVAVMVAGYGWRAVPRAVGWSILPVIVLVTPWTLRNISALDSPVAYSTNMGDTVCIDRGPGATGTFRFTSHSGCAAQDDPEAKRNWESTRKALAYVVGDPLRELRQIPKRARYIVEHDHDGLDVVEAHGTDPFLGDRLRTVLRRLADWYFYTTGVLAVVGLPALFRRGDRRPERLIVLIALATLVIVPLGLWGTPRFHVPALPFAAVAAAVPLSRVTSRLRDRATSRVSPAAGLATP
jgi:4-amino-4-deoxy-L-arabinose transferase-like glycosyltransferase